MARTVTKLKRSVLEVTLPDVYDRWRIVIRMRDKLMGSMPKEPRALDRFAASVAPTEQDAQELSDKLKTEMPTDELADVGASGFKRDPALGLYIEARQLKAAFKESATLMALTDPKKSGHGPGRQFFQHAFFVEPDRIYLDKHEPDGIERMFGNVMTPQGPRSIVRNVDYVEGVTIEFFVKALKNFKTAAARKSDAASIKDDEVQMMLALMQDNGIGACRSQGYGKMDVVEYETL